MTRLNSINLFSNFVIILVIMVPNLLVNSFPTGVNNGYQSDGNYYATSCPQLGMIVRFGVWQALSADARMAASLLRLHFHDCLVDGCDASVLLDDKEDFKGEKNTLPNKNSLRGFEVIDSIKETLEIVCPSTVSCADILALAAREAIALSGGPFWPVWLGRRDGPTATEASAYLQLPGPTEPLKDILKKFVSKGFTVKDVVALSGGHTVGYARCSLFKDRLYNYKSTGTPDPILDSSTLVNLQRTCPDDGPDSASDSNLVPLDSSASRFDNTYFVNLVNKTGLLESDQVLLADPRTSPFVKAYSNDPFLFNKDFADAMVKMSKIGLLTGQSGEIRKKCGSVN